MRALDKINFLKAHNKWSFRQLKRSKPKRMRQNHWGHLIKEAQWLQTDFKEERKWKMAAAFQISQAVLEWHRKKNEAASASTLSSEKMQIETGEMQPQRIFSNKPEIAEIIPANCSFLYTMPEDQDISDSWILADLPVYQGPTISDIYEAFDDQPEFDTVLPIVRHMALPSVLPTVKNVSQVRCAEAAFERYVENVHESRKRAGSDVPDDLLVPQYPRAGQSKSARLTEISEKLYMSPAPFSTISEATIDSSARQNFPESSLSRVAIPEHKKTGLDSLISPIFNFPEQDRARSPVQRLLAPPANPRSTITWTPDEEELLIMYANMYRQNWDLIADVLNAARGPATSVVGGRLRPWDCFLQWSKLEKVAAAISAVNADSGVSSPGLAMTPVVKRDSSKLVKAMEKKRSARHFNILDAMKRSAMKREEIAKTLCKFLSRSARHVAIDANRSTMPAKNISRTVNLAAHETHSQPNVLMGVNLTRTFTPAELSRTKVDRDQQMAKALQEQRQAQAAYAVQVQARMRPVCNNHCTRKLVYETDQNC